MSEIRNTQKLRQSSKANNNGMDSSATTVLKEPFANRATFKAQSYPATAPTTAHGADGSDGFVRLFHLTADRESHWGAILASGVILPHEDVGPRPGVEMAPTYHPEDAKVDRLVWLTCDPWKPQGWMAGQPKGTIWIEVNPDAIDAIRWSDYAPIHFSPKYAEMLSHPRFGDSGNWYVVEQPIPKEAWLDVTRPARVTRAA